MNILHSASRIAFLLIVLTACAGFFFKRLDPKDFMVLAGAAFTYYFSKSSPHVEKEGENEQAPAP